MTASKMELKQIHPSQLGKKWSKLEALLLERPETWNRIDTLDSIKFGLEVGARDLWFLFKNGKMKMAVITQIIVRPAGRALQVVWANGGDAKDLIVLMDAAERIADQHECQWVEVLGRPGWSRLLKPYGFYVDFQVSVKPVVSRRAN